MGDAGSVKLARSYRRRSTPAEQRLWACLRDRQFVGLKFRRQHPKGGYVVDFYCADRRLLVELDGSVHHYAEQQAYDRFRDEQFGAAGITVLRVTNTEVEQSLSQVLERIKACAGLLS